MRALNLDQLQTLVTIADLGSFAAAARALHLAPPTISLHISELESRLDAPLLVRGRSQVVPTGIGLALIERSRRLLADAQQAVEEVSRQRQGQSGRVRLGASTGVLAQLLPQTLEVLGRQHPGIDVQVAVLTSQETIKSLQAGRLDIGLVALPQSAVPGVRISPWRRDPVRAFVPSGWQAPKFATPKWLAGKPLIFNDSSTRLHRMTAEWFAHAGQQPHPRIELNYNDAMKSLVAAGYGAALIPLEANREPIDPRIRVLELRPALWRPLGIAQRNDPPEPACQHVLEVLSGFRQGDIL